jgi:L-amino acid N-acyltransferase YncA
VKLRLAQDSDFPKLWPILEAVIRAGETYALDPTMTREAARALWLDTPSAASGATWLVEERGEVLGTYYYKANFAGGARHIANAGFMVSTSARGRGVGRRMAEHCLVEAKTAGFSAMQFNFVVANNPALALWQTFGFSIIGTIPSAFEHPTHGRVEAHIMYKTLD